MKIVVYIRGICIGCRARELKSDQLRKLIK